MDLVGYLLAKNNASPSPSPTPQGLDWTLIGYSSEPSFINTGYEYAKTIYDSWDNSQTDLESKYENDENLIFMPLVDTSNVTKFYSTFKYCKSLIHFPLIDTSSVTDFRYMFRGCYSLRDIPQLDLSSATNAQNMFTECFNLTDESLDNILKMCININPSYAKTKTLSNIGFVSSNYPATRISALPSYQDFLTAGWTIGY